MSDFDVLQMRKEARRVVDGGRYESKGKSRFIVLRLLDRRRACSKIAE